MALRIASSRASDLDGDQVERVWREGGDAGAGAGACGANEASHLGGLVGAHVVEHDDVAELQLAQKHALEEGLEDFAVSGALHDHCGAHAGRVERAGHRGHRDRVPRLGSVFTFAARARAYSL